MNKYIYFGEKVKRYPIRVLNEREVRASAGLLFLFAIISFLNAWHTGNFDYTRIFVTVFLIDFIIRVFINPKYSPSLILGKLIVRNQKPEYIGAPQKRFAWGIGLGLAITMFYLIVLNDVIGPINLFICLSCLILLFFETAFGICIGCFIYNLFNKQKAQLCPGNSCKTKKQEEIQKVGLPQLIILVLFILTIFFIPSIVLDKSQPTNSIINNNINIKIKENIDEKCIPPQWAIDIGHEEMWKLHNGCD